MRARRTWSCATVKGMTKTAIPSPPCCITSCGPTPPTFRSEPSPRAWFPIASARSIPTDGGRAWRSSLSFNDHATVGEGQFTASAFFIDNQLHLWNDFTQFLVDPVHGDQEDQFENRRALGGQAIYTVPVPLGSIPNVISAGALTRDDMSDVGRLPSEDRVPLPAADDPPSFSNVDQVYLFAGPPGCRRPLTGLRNSAACSGFARIISMAPTSTIWLRCTRSGPDTRVHQWRHGTAVTAPAQGKPHLHADRHA